MRVRSLAAVRHLFGPVLFYEFFVGWFLALSSPDTL